MRECSKKRLNHMNAAVLKPMSTDARLPRYQQVRDQLTRRIAAGEWPPGQAIPTEPELCAQYEVSIGTLRKAIDVLVSEGMLVREQGRGTFVRRPSFASSFFRFFRFRGASGESVTPSSQLVGREVAIPPADARDALNLSTADAALHIDRIRLVANKTVLLEEIWLPVRGFEPLIDLPLEAFGDLLYPLYERVCKRLVAQASETLTVERATALQAEALGVEGGAPLIRVQRVAYDYAGQAIEWRVSHGAAVHFQYHTEIR